MPNFLILFTSKHDTSRSGESAEDEENVDLKKIIAASMQLYQKWMTDELQAQRIIHSGGALDASKQTQARIRFQDAGIDDKFLDKLMSLTDGTIDASDGLKPVSQIDVGPIDDPVAITSYFIVKQESLEAVLDWAKTAPIFAPGISFEIRQLIEEIEDEPSRDFVVEQVIGIREKMVGEGKMKIDEDGTHWVKLDDEEDLKDHDLAERIASMELKSDILSKARGAK